MDFFGVGPLELLLVLVITLIVVGPHRLPEVAAELARLVRTLRQYAATVSREFNETLGELEQEYREMKGEWKEIGQGLEEGTRVVSDELAVADREAGQAMSEAAALDEPSQSLPRSP